MEDNRNGMPDLLDLQEFDEEALKRESEEVLQMRLMTAENAVFTRTEGRLSFPEVWGKDL